MEAETVPDEEDVLEMIYTIIDALLRRKNFVEVNQILASTRVSDLSILQLVALVSITRSAKDRLLSRPDFIKRVREHLTQKEPARVNALLADLE